MPVERIFEESSKLDGQVCADALYMLHALSHLSIDINTAVDCHHDSPRLALEIVKDAGNHLNVLSVAIAQLQSSLVNYIELLDSEDVDDDAENPRDPVRDRVSRPDYS